MTSRKKTSFDNIVAILNCFHHGDSHNILLSVYSFVTKLVKIAFVTRHYWEIRCMKNFFERICSLCRISNCSQNICTISSGASTFLPPNMIKHCELTHEENDFVMTTIVLIVLIVLSLPDNL